MRQQTEPLTVYLTPALADAVRHAAHSEDRPVSGWVRRALDAATSSARQQAGAEHIRDGESGGTGG